jgi:1-deoxy-D-xylulose-5-phosphate synthase
MGASDRYPHLARAGTPADLRTLPEQELPAVASELRTFLIDTVSQMGGHFAAGLGTVESGPLVRSSYHADEQSVKYTGADHLNISPTLASV